MRTSHLRTLTLLLAPVALAVTPALMAACSGGSSEALAGGKSGVGQNKPGQTSFVSATPGGQQTGGAHGASGGFATDSAADAGAAAAPAAASTTTSTTRTVQETDLYRLDGNTLYYLNSYRGLMVFDVTNVDHPKLLGRSAIFGSPVDMIVDNGIATVIVGDWYGTDDNGNPFYGSIVRGLDATDPTNIKVLGDVKIRGDIQDSRVVGNVLYAVSEDFGWEYGCDYYNSYYNVADVIVSSVDFANGQVKGISTKTYAGYGGVFNVTPNAIMLAHTPNSTVDGGNPPAVTSLQYLDITDPGGTIVERGNITVNGNLQAWGADNGRWTLDFAAGKTAHVIGCAGNDWNCGQDGYVLSTVDFSNPAAPALDSSLAIADTGWSITALFDSGRMYLSPSSDYFYGSSESSTPLAIYDLSDPAHPTLAGSASIPGQAWLLLPSGNQLFDLGQTNGDTSSQVSLTYLDVTKASAPKVIGTSTFGDGWAWTPAAETF